MFFNYIRKYEKTSGLINIIMIIVSLLLIINPAGVINTVVIVFGLGVLIDGIFRLITYFLEDNLSRMFSGDFFQGAISCLGGVLIILNKTLLISIFPTLIGFWLIIRSIIKLQVTFNLKSVNSEKWLMLLISAIVTLALGILIISNPFGTVYAISAIAGIILLISSTIDLIENIVIIKALNDFKD